jgi:hypothetical protein
VPAPTLRGEATTARLLSLQVVVPGAEGLPVAGIPGEIGRLPHRDHVVDDLRRITIARPPCQACLTFAGRMISKPSRSCSAPGRLTVETAQDDQPLCDPGGMSALGGVVPRGSKMIKLSALGYLALLRGFLPKVIISDWL